MVPIKPEYLPENKPTPVWVTGASSEPLSVPYFVYNSKLIRVIRIENLVYPIG